MDCSVKKKKKKKKKRGVTPHSSRIRGWGLDVLGMGCGLVILFFRDSVGYGLGTLQLQKPETLFQVFSMALAICGTVAG